MYEILSVLNTSKIHIKISKTYLPHMQKQNPYSVLSHHTDCPKAM